MNVSGLEAGNGSAGFECETDWGVSESEKLLRFVLHGVLLNGIGLLGLLGNALAVLVLTRPQMRSSVNCLLVGLAACDTVLIVTSVLLFGLSAVFPYTGRLRHYYYHVCPRLTPVAYPLATAAQTMSVYLTLVVTLERWVAVCHPFRAKALCTSARARWYVLGTALFSLAYNAPRLFEAEVYRAAGGAYCVRARRAFRTDTYVLVYIHWLYLVVMYIAPFGALAALNLCIARQVRRAQAERARLSRVQRRELGIASMLLVVVLVFFLCNLLPLVTNALEALQGDGGGDGGGDGDGGGSSFADLDPLVKTGNLLVMINSSVNFLVYVTFGEKFKRVFLKMFCARRALLPRGATGARDSPEHTRDDSFASCERVSLRLARNGTLRRSELRSLRAPTAAPATAPAARASSRRAPATVYYPAPSSAPHTDVTCASTPDADDAGADDDARWNGHARAHY